ncbi:MAG TPA: hypothetical protein VF480_07675 [Verrucomicrobiae bacterium]
MRLKSFILLSALALLTAAPVRADLTLSMTPLAQSGLVNNEIFLIGTLTNTSLTTNLFLNSLQITLTGATTNYLTADTNAFFANVPGILLPGENDNDAVFAVAVNASAHPTNFSGTVTIQGGADVFSTNNLATQAFQVSVPPAALGMTRAGSNLILSWPSPPAGFVLQQISGLNGTNWVAATNTPLFTNGQNQVALSPSISSQFYRLKYP